MGAVNMTTRYTGVYADIYVGGNVVYMGRVNNSNKTWHVLICVVYNKKKNIYIFF